MRPSRIIFILSTIIFGIIAVTVFLRLMANKNSTEMFQAPKNSEYPRWELPEGAKMRLGKGSINSIKFSPYGSRFAVATSIGVWIYDAQSGSILSLLKGERQNILDVAFTENGNTVIGINATGEILKWRAENGELVFTLSNEKAVYLTSAVFATDGSMVYGVGRVRDENLYVWELNDDMNPHVLVPIFTEIKLDVEFIGGYGKIIANSPDGRFLATPRQEDHNEYFPIYIFDARTGKLLFKWSAQSNDWVRALAFSPNSKTITACTSDSIYLWDTDAKDVKATFKAPATSFYALAFSPNGKLLASGCSDGSVRLWNATAQQEGFGGTIGQYLPTFQLKGHKNKVNKLVFSPDGNTLLTGSLDGTIRAWDTTTGRMLYKCPGHLEGIRHLAASKQTSILTSVDSFPTIVRLWDIKKGHQLSASYFGFTSSVSISPNATTISLDDQLNRKLLWDIQNRRYRYYLKGHGYPSKFFLHTTIAFSKDEKRIATSPSRGPLGEIHIWDIGKQSNSIFNRFFFNAKTIRPKHTLNGHRGVVRSLVFSPDRKTLVSSGDGDRISLWDMETLRIHQKFVVGRNHSQSVIFSSDGNILASRGTEKIICWEVATGKQISEFPRITGSFMSMQFCPDSNILVSGINTGEVQLWDVSSGNFLSTHKGHTKYIYALRFLENGKTLATASEDGTILLWNWEKMKTEIK